MAVYPFSQGNTADSTLDAVAVELEAMQAIARALAGIRDPQIRQRVLQWANERFNIGPTPQPQPPRPRPEITETTDESGLDVGPLYDFFNVPRPSTQRLSLQADAPAPIANADVAPVADSLYDFFEHPRAAAQAAAVQATPAVIATAPAAPTAPARELRAVPDAREPREDAALDTMVKGFASELQRLAVEWQTA
jgi:hypothetical protein